MSAKKALKYEDESVLLISAKNVFIKECAQEVFAKTYTARSYYEAVRFLSHTVPGVIIYHEMLGISNFEKLVNLNVKTSFVPKYVLITPEYTTETLLKLIKLNVSEVLLDERKYTFLKNKLLEVKQRNNNAADILRLNNDYYWNKNTKKLYDYDDVEVKLTRQEYLIIMLLLSQPNTVFQINEIIKYINDTETIEKKHQASLRTSLYRFNIKTNHSNLIESHYGMGYKINTF